MRPPTSCLASGKRRPQRRHQLLTSRSTLICSLVIALSSALVISIVQSTSIAAEKPITAASQATPVAPASAPAPAAPAASAAPAPEPVKVPVEAAAAVKPRDAQPAAEVKSAAAAIEQPKVSEAANSKAQESEQARKGRSEAPGGDSAAKQTTEKPGEASKTSATDKSASSGLKSATDQQKSATAASSKSSSSTGSSSNKSQLAGKSGHAPTSSTGKKLPANLGTVTSTGSGGPAHYMSKHDAYSAIAEKHGALAHADVMRKADKRQHHASNLQQRFGGIQKASGLGDALNPFKSVSDSGLARTLGASMRSIMKGKYSVPAYLASAVLGAVALMAFYESPISPLPVPALPEPPIGRFPPEMPVISPNLQVPFRTNQGQQQQYGQQYGNYANQRSSFMQPQQQQQQQQVLFPGATAQAAQQRQGSSPGPVQQLAANLISSVNNVGKQTAQRKSGADYDAASSRSFFGSSSTSTHHSPGGANKLGAPANHAAGANKQSGLLSFLGLGGASAASDAATQASSQQPALSSLTDIHRASGLGAHHVGAGGGPVASAPGHEHKGQSALSNSHLVNKMKSYFDRPVAHSSWSMDHNVPNQYDQYRRMSIIQALAKDTAFLSSFFSPSRRSSNSSSPISASQIQQSINSVLSAASGNGGASQQQAAARMQVDSIPGASLMQVFQPQQQQQQQQPSVNTKRASSGYGLMKTADRLGHALIDTFTSGLLHRSSSSSDSSARKSALDEQQQQQQRNAIVSATSLLSDIMSSYNAQANVQAQQQQQQQQLSAASETATGKQQPQQQQQLEQASGRSADSQPAVGASSPSSSPVAQPTEQSVQAAPVSAAAAQTIKSSSSPDTSSAHESKAQPSSIVPTSSASQQPLSRKTRSIGIEYPIEQLQPQYQQQQQPQPPSRASQINNLVDYVSDSYKQNKLLFSFVMNQVGLSQALPYVDSFLGTPNEIKDQ